MGKEECELTNSVYHLQSPEYIPSSYRERCYDPRTMRPGSLRPMLRALVTQPGSVKPRTFPAIPPAWDSRDTSINASGALAPFFKNRHHALGKLLRFRRILRPISLLVR